MLLGTKLCFVVIFSHFKHSVTTPSPSTTSNQRPEMVTFCSKHSSMGPTTTRNIQAWWPPFVSQTRMLLSIVSGFIWLCDNLIKIYRVEEKQHETRVNWREEVKGSQQMHQVRSGKKRVGGGGASKLLRMAWHTFWFLNFWNTMKFRKLKIVCNWWTDVQPNNQPDGQRPKLLHSWDDTTKNSGVGARHNFLVFKYCDLFALKQVAFPYPQPLAMNI